MSFKNVLHQSKYFILVYVFHLTFSHFILPSLGFFDLYPFFQWNLYSFIPDQQSFYFVRVDEINNQKLDRPIWVHEARHQFKGVKPFLVPYQIISFGKCLQSPECTNSTEIETFKKNFENNIFKSELQAKYQIYSLKMSSREAIYTIEKERLILLSSFSMEKIAGTNE